MVRRGRYKQKKELHLANLPALERTKTAVTFNFKHRTARTKINPKNIKKVLDLSKLTLFGIRDRTGTMSDDTWMIKSSMHFIEDVYF